MTAEEAVKAISRLTEATETVINQMDKSRGMSKKAEKEERRAAAALFKALTGEKASDEQIGEMTGG
jgi:hypothetical protein